jgi:hypothetical protein
MRPPVLASWPEGEPHQPRTPGGAVREREMPNMNRFVRLTLLSAFTAALAACGGGAKLGGGKSGAAQAVFQASQPVGQQGTSAQALLGKALANGQNTLDTTVTCEHGGKATLKVDTSYTGGGDVENLTFAYDVTYAACNVDGKNEYNGSMKTVMTLDADFTNGGTTAEIVYKLNGKLTLEGEVSDFVEAKNLTMTMSLSANSANDGASVGMTLNGSIATSTESYVYTNESITITTGELPRS